MKNIFFLLIVITSFFGFAQAPVIAWQKTIGGSLKDWGTTTIKTQDSGYLICGESQSSVSGDKTMPSNGMSDYWVLKINTLGIIEWQKDFGGSDYDVPTVALQTSDGGYLIGGNSQSNISGDKTENSHGFSDIWLLKLDSNGNILWQNTIGASYTDILQSLVQTPDGGYLLGASSVSSSSGDKTEDNIGLPFGLPYYTYFDYWIIKLDALGNIEWDNTIGSKESDVLSSVVNASDGGYLIGGFSNCDVSGDYNGIHVGGYDCWILKIDTLGNIIWQKTIGGTLKDQLRSIVNVADGGYLLGAISNSNASGNKTENSKGGDDYWIIKIDYQGNILWDKTYGGAGNDWLFPICQDNNGNFYIGGKSNSSISGDKTENSRGGYDNWIIKLDPLGNKLWDKTIGGAGDEDFGSFSLISENNLLLASSSNSNISGDITENSNGDYDLWLVKLEPDNLSSIIFNSSTVNLYPNPTTKTTHIRFPKVYKNLRLSVTNVLGQFILEKIASNTDKIDVDLDDAKGIYFIKVENENNEFTTFKVVKE